jgi:hypothetical protein
MSLEPLLEEVRRYYVDRLMKAVADRAAEADVEVVHEAALRRVDGEIATAGELDLPARTDVVILRDGQATDSLLIDTEKMLSFEPLDFDWPDSELRVELYPFQWNLMQVRVYGLPATPDWSPLREWFLSWFKDEDPAAGEPLEAVHFLSDPEQQSGFAELTIDLGTAPLEAFEQLVDVVAALGAARAEIGKFGPDALPGAPPRDDKRDE